jgi:signal transduction histidine kinase
MRAFAETFHTDATDFRGVFDQLPAPLALVSVAGAEPRLTAVSEGFLLQLQAGRGAVEGRRIEEVFRAAAGEHVGRIVRDCLEAGEPKRVRIAQACGDQVVRMDVEARAVAAGVILTAKALEPFPTLAQVGEAGVLNEMAPLMGGLIFIHDLKKRRVRYGQHPVAMSLGMTEGVSNPDEIRALVHPRDLAAFRRHLREQAQMGDRDLAAITLRLRAADGAWLWFTVGTRVLERDGEGAVRRIIGLARDVTSQRRTRDDLADAAAALAHAELNERRRIGRELHDSTAQLLVAARLGLGALERRLEPDAARRGLIAEIRRSLAAAQREIRNFSYMLHPPNLQQEGLQKTLETFGAGFGHRTGLAVSVEVRDGPWSLPAAVEIALFRVTQEALMNVYRHARARHATVRLGREGEAVVLEIEDDGIGLRRRGRGKPLEPAGVGVVGMQARMTQLGGALSLTPGRRGLTVRAWAPAPD